MNETEPFSSPRDIPVAEEEDGDEQEEEDGDAFLAGATLFNSGANGATATPPLADSGAPRGAPGGEGGRSGGVRLGGGGGDDAIH